MQEIYDREDDEDRRERTGYLAIILGVLVLFAAVAVAVVLLTDEDDPDPVRIHLKNNRFHPEARIVKVGQEIRWVNDDGYAHNVIATKGSDFKSANFATGTFTNTPEDPGTIEYVCTLHKGMDGKIIVGDD